MALRRTALGNPEPPQAVLTEPECHAIRCRFKIAGPRAHDVRLVGDTMKNVRCDGGRLFRDFQTTELPTEANGHFAVQILAAYAFDYPDITEIEAGPPA